MKRQSIIAIILISILFCCKKEVDGVIANIKTDNMKTSFSKNDSIIDYYEISINESFQIELVSNPSTGYSWKWINEKKFTSVIETTVSHTFISDKPHLQGSPGKEIWKFKGVKIGIDTIKLEYNRGWEKGSTINRKKIIVKVNE